LLVNEKTLFFLIVYICGFNRQMRIGLAAIHNEQMGLSSSNIALNHSALQMMPDVLGSVYAEYVRAHGGDGQGVADFDEILSPERGGYRVRIYFDESGHLSLTREWFPAKDRYFYNCVTI
jgi:hypothetical protein